jgi:8-oxo-dGTP pyrophosphatase MutT (NUDIX family)
MSVTYTKLWAHLIDEIKEKRKTIACVTCINENDEILILKRSSDETSKQGYWDLPGGHVDDEDKSLEDGVLRELQEETGLKSNLTSLKYVDKIVSDDADKYYYATRDWTGSVKLTPNPKTGVVEHTDAKWKTIDEIKNEKSLELRTFPTYLLDRALEKAKPNN